MVRKSPTRKTRAPRKRRVVFIHDAPDAQSVIVTGTFCDWQTDCYALKDELKHAAFLADKIVALGGTPDIKPAYPTPLTDPCEALKRERDHEGKAIEGYKERVQQADACGEIGLRVELENIIADETRHYEELDRLLR